MVSICSRITENISARRLPDPILSKRCASVSGGFSRFLNHWRLCSRRDGRQHIFLCINQRRSVVAGYFEAVPVGDGVRGAGFHTITAENAAVVIDVIDFGVPLAAADPYFIG